MRIGVIGSNVISAMVAELMANRLSRVRKATLINLTGQDVPRTCPVNAVVYGNTVNDVSSYADGYRLIVEITSERIYNACGATDGGPDVILYVPIGDRSKKLMDLFADLAVDVDKILALAAETNPGARVRNPLFSTLRDVDEASGVSTNPNAKTYRGGAY